MNNETLMTDFYELTMAQTYFEAGKKDEIAYFDVFFRKNLFNGGYTISGGLDRIIKYLNNFKISREEIEALRNTKYFTEEFLSYLSEIRFTGDIYAVPDGTPIFPNEPIITVKTNLIEAQIIETAVLACFNYGSLVVTSAKRITNEAGNIPVMEFGARRARGIEAAVEASKYAYVGGCAGTSNVLAGLKYHIPLLGTMAHSLVTEAENEYEAFLEYAKSNPDNCVFLVDTYDTLRQGIPNAIKVARDYLIPNGYKFKGIRIDSGDLAYLSCEARKLLDDAGFSDTKICLSNGIDENIISELLKNGACIDSLGIGDNISAAKERLGGVYKLVAIEKDGHILPRIKVSNDTVKTINPGYKRVYRFFDKETNFALGDVVALYDEEIPSDFYELIHPIDNWKKTRLTNYYVKELQVPIFKNGIQVYKDITLEEEKIYCNKEFGTLYPEIKRLINPHEYYVDLSYKLLTLKNDLIAKHRA